MRRFRRVAPLVLGMSVVLALGGVGFIMSKSANDKAQDIHRDDRLTLEATLAGLADQYFQFALKEAFDFSSRQAWSLRPGDPNDAEALRGFVQRAALLQHAAALVDLTGQPLNAFASEPGIPPEDDPGYDALRIGLLARQPGFSSVMNFQGVPMVALAVPVVVDATPRAIFVAYFRADKSPLQTYNERITYGETGHSFLLDSLGGVIAASDASQLGKKFPSPEVVRALADGETGFVEYRRDGVAYVSSYSPIGVGGWGSVIEQSSTEFFGPMRSGGLRVALALGAVLIAAALALTVLNQKRQSALRDAYDYKGQLLANTTHELKTPLTAIRGAAMTLGVRWRDMRPDQVDQFLGIIHRRCDGLGKLIERILIGARLEAGREVSMHPESINVIGLLRRTAAEFADASADHHLSVEADPNLWIHADQDALDQVLGLLVENAIKYSPAGGEVRLTARRDGDRASLAVADEGIGIAERDREHIFDPYYRAHRGDASSFAGVGLGLSIARHFVRLHGGRLGVDSTQGHGSTFRFDMPATLPSADHKIDVTEGAR